MRHISIFLVAILFANAFAGCRRQSKELQYHSVGYAWSFVGTPGQPRAIIRIEDQAPHTILITEGRFTDSSLSTSSGDAAITLLNTDGSKDTKTVHVPKGRVGVIDNSGVFTLLEEDIVRWNDGHLEYTPSASPFDGLLQRLITSSNQHNQ